MWPVRFECISTRLSKPLIIRRPFPPNLTAPSTLETVTPSIWCFSAFWRLAFSVRRRSRSCSTTNLSKVACQFETMLELHSEFYWDSAVNSSYLIQVIRRKGLMSMSMYSNRAEPGGIFKYALGDYVEFSTFVHALHLPDSENGGWAGTIRWINNKVGHVE